jgi:DNA-binding transcriptional ArsR family regulator
LFNILYNIIRCLSKYLIIFKGGVAVPPLNLPFKALSDPTRRKIILLLKDKDLTAGEIAEHFNMTKPSISHHLSTLKQASLVIDERKGQNIVYTLNTTVFQEVINWFFNATHINEGGKE